ncbi:hypothetical protein BDF14DRAFT_1816267 [Spinellus fusiger]|nr:hypothetical protein BDF14DRAFT_1816267 [Spinellus fusiger]
MTYKLRVFFLRFSFICMEEFQWCINTFELNCIAFSFFFPFDFSHLKMMMQTLFKMLGLDRQSEKLRFKGNAKITSVEKRYLYLQQTTPHTPLKNKDKELERIKKMAQWLDHAVPGSPVPLGLDSLLSFIPLIGGFIGCLFAFYQVYLSTQFGIPLWLLFRMILNICVDLLIGMIPLAGGFLDMFYKANLWNAEALEDWLNNPELTIDPDTKMPVVPPQISWQQLVLDIRDYLSTFSLHPFYTAKTALA